MTAPEVAIAFSLPGPQWSPAEPEQGAFFAAIRCGHHSGFVPTIVIDGARPQASTQLFDAAEASLRRLTAISRTVTLLGRDEGGFTDRTSSLTQLVSFEIAIEETVRRLCQTQVFVDIADEDAPEQRYVYSFILTVAEVDLASVLPEFQQFLRSVVPE